MIDSFFYGSCRADYNMCKLGKVESGHGDGVVRQLSVDLKERYPKMGLSPRNLWYMKRFYLRYCRSDVKVQRSVALLPWSHNVYLELSVTFF